MLEAAKSGRAEGWTGVREIPSGGTVSFISTFLVSTVSVTAILAAVKDKKTRPAEDQGWRQQVRPTTELTLPSEHINLHGDDGCCEMLGVMENESKGKKM